MLHVDIHKAYANSQSPHFQLQVCLDFPPGFTVLFGPSGAGKSTLLDCVAGLATPDEGVIRLNDEILFDAAKNIALPPQRRGIGYTFQSLALFPHLTVEENVRFGISRQSSSDQQARSAQILQTFHIHPLAMRRPRELSGGEQQRVALARSLVTRPHVLLLDEPLTGLDAALRQSILQDLREWNDANRIPILYVTHNREEVDAIGERVVALVDGRVRETGLPGDVLDAPRTLALAQSAGFENLFTARVLEQRVDDGVMRVALSEHCDLEVPLGLAGIDSEIRIAIRAGDILLATEHPHGLSARNVLQGIVESLETSGALVVVRVQAGVAFEVHVTPGAVRSLELRPALPVWLVIKTHSCRIVT